MRRGKGGGGGGPKRKFYWVEMKMKTLSFKGEDMPWYCLQCGTCLITHQCLCWREGLLFRTALGNYPKQGNIKFKLLKLLCLGSLYIFFCPSSGQILYYLNFICCKRSFIKERGEGGDCCFHTYHSLRFCFCHT